MDAFSFLFEFDCRFFGIAVVFLEVLIMRKKKQRNIIIAVVAVVVLAVIAFFSFGKKGSQQSAKTVTVTVGTVGATKAERAIWKSVAATAKKKYGIIVKTKNFSDYNQPNSALKSGDLDLNAFQHYNFLNNWNKANKSNLVAIGKTYIAPIRLYSLKYKSLKSLPKGATIAIPNDATNEARALLVLKNAGLITLKGTSATKLYSVADIKSNPKNFKIKEVATEQAARVLKSVDAAVVNNDYANPAGLGDKQTIYVEPINKDSYQWINIIVARKKDKNKKAYKEVVKAYQTEKTKQLYKKYYGIKQVAAWDAKF